MTFIERALRVMTHINIGASLGVAAWLMLGSIDLVSANVASRSHPVQFVQPLHGGTCGCATNVAVAERAL